MAENDLAAVEHLRAARRHLRSACIAVEDDRPRAAAALSRLVADVNGLVPAVDDQSTGPAVDRPQRVLDALTDPDCRRILAATGGEAHTVSEVAEACAIPVSTVYRKVDRLVDAGLLDGDIRVESPGPHAREYRRTVDDVHVFLDDAHDGVVPDDGPRVVAPPESATGIDTNLARDDTAVTLFGDADDGR